MQIIRLSPHYFYYEFKIQLIHFKDTWHSEMSSRRNKQHLFMRFNRLKGVDRN